MIRSLFAPLAMKIAGGLALTLAVMLGVQSWRLSSAHNENEALRASYAMSEAQHSITRQSLGELEARLADMIEAGKVTESNLEAAVAEQAERSADLREQAADIAAAVPVDCETNGAVMSAEGL